MSLFRALAYFFEEALTSLWRSRLMNAVSVFTIAVSLFVLGSFLVVAANLAQVVERWTARVQVTFYLKDRVDTVDRERLTARLRAQPGVEGVVFVDAQAALARFQEMFADLRSLPDELGVNPFPPSLEVSLQPGIEAAAEVKRLVEVFGSDPAVEEVQYDLLWIERLSTGVRLVRGVGALLGGILVLAGIFTISNVIRLTVYARQDELDIMRLVGATRAYVVGPFVVEGMLQGGLGGLVSVGLLYVGFRLFAQEALAASDILGRAVVFLPASTCAAIVVGGMAVGVVGSVVSIGRLKM